MTTKDLPIIANLLYLLYPILLELPELDLLNWPEEYRKKVEMLRNIAEKDSSTRCNIISFDLACFNLTNSAKYAIPASAENEI